MGRYHRYKSVDYKLHTRRLRHKKAQILFPVLCGLCVLAGLLTLTIALLVFRQSGFLIPQKWAWFCMSYFAAALVFFVVSWILRNTQQKQHSYRRQK